ncbi:transcriptional regulator domain-containing protein [Phyllobacterium sp. K27]
MEPLQDWQSPHFEHQLSSLDRGGVSFEFLRRNREYRTDYKTTLEEIISGKARKDEAIARLSRRWGLEFPCRSHCLRPRSRSLVAPAALSCHRDCQGSPERLCCLLAF